MRDVGDHADVATAFERLFQGNERLRAALLQLSLLRHAAAGTAHRLKTELLDHQRIEFGIGAARHHRRQAAAARIDDRRQQMLPVPDREDRRRDSPRRTSATSAEPSAGRLVARTNRRPLASKRRDRSLGKARLRQAACGPSARTPSCGPTGGAFSSPHPASHGAPTSAHQSWPSVRRCPDRAGDAGGRRNSAYGHCRRWPAPCSSRPSAPSHSPGKMPTMSSSSRSRNSFDFSDFSSPPKTRCRSCFLPSSSAMSMILSRCENLHWSRGNRCEFWNRDRIMARSRLRIRKPDRPAAR